MFGGMITKDGAKTNELFWLSTDRMEWHNQLTTGTKPCPRDGHTVAYDELKNRLVGLSPWTTLHSFVSGSSANRNAGGGDRLL